MTHYKFTDMSDYERKAWASIQKQLGRQRARREMVPRPIRDFASTARDKAQDAWDRVPGNESFEAVLHKAMLGLKNLVFDPALHSVVLPLVLRDYQKSGYDIHELCDIRKLDLSAIDDIMPSLRARYAVVSAVQGAAAGVAVTGEELATFGASAATGGAAAPVGVSTVIGTMAADTVGVLAASARVVAHIGAYYGYPVKGPEEELYAMGVLNFGTATTQGAKNKAFIDLSNLAKLTAKGATWEKLNKFAIARVLKRLYLKLGDKLTKRKLAGALPVVGIVVGAGMNAHTLQDVANRAELAYRSRFLMDKHGLTTKDFLPGPGLDEAGEDIIDINSILDSELEGTPEDTIDLDLGDNEAPAA